MGRSLSNCLELSDKYGRISIFIIPSHIGIETKDDVNETRNGAYDVEQEETKAEMRYDIKIMKKKVKV